MLRGYDNKITFDVLSQLMEIDDSIVFNKIDSENYAESEIGEFSIDLNASKLRVSPQITCKNN